MRSRAQEVAFLSLLTNHRKPEDIPTLDELPEANTDDLVQAYQYQSTIDENFEQ